LARGALVVGFLGDPARLELRGVRAERDELRLRQPFDVQAHGLIVDRAS
jgi:hypothetical protein